MEKSVLAWHFVGATLRDGRAMVSEPVRFAYWHPRRLEWVRYDDLPHAREAAQAAADRYGIAVSVCTMGRPVAIVRPTRAHGWLDRLRLWLTGAP